LKPNPDKRLGWRARYTDPDSGKRVYRTIPAEHAGTLEARQRWAVNKSAEIAGRKRELAGGAPRATGTGLAEVLERYFSAHIHWSPRTLADYRRARDRLLKWAAIAGVSTADEVTRVRLLAFREYLIRLPARPGTGVNGLRTGATVNAELRSMRTILGYLVDAELLPRLTRDDLRRIKRLKVPIERIEHLNAAEIARAIEAALKHDESAGSRHAPIARFLVFLLLSGCRLGEGVRLTWPQIDFDACDDAGRPIGLIHLHGAATKTGEFRPIGLEVSPALRAMLAVMRDESGGKGPVFAFTERSAANALERLRDKHGAPERFTWHALRRTCETYLVCSPGIFGGSNTTRAAEQLGHSVLIAQNHYVGLIRGIPATATTLEAAMGIEDLVGRIIGNRKPVSPAEQATAAL
jgi:integrase